MNNGNTNRLDRIEELLETFIAASIADRKSSNERMTRIEQGLEETRKLVNSNNRFLEAFSTKIERYTDSMNNIATRIDGVIATSNQDRQDITFRMAAIQRQVAAIAKHLGVT